MNTHTHTHTHTQLQIATHISTSPKTIPTIFGIKTKPEKRGTYFASTRNPKKLVVAL
jgi:uncharacterized protein YhbP (UPF0306 family)